MPSLFSDLTFASVVSNGLCWRKVLKIDLIIILFNWFYLIIVSVTEFTNKTKIPRNFLLSVSKNVLQTIFHALIFLKRLIFLKVCNPEPEHLLTLFLRSAFSTYSFSACFHGYFSKRINTLALSEFFLLPTCLKIDACFWFLRKNKKRIKATNKVCGN